MKLLITALLAGWALASTHGPTPQVYLGEISDTQCAFNVHSHNSSHEDMIKNNTMGSTPEECVRACIKRSGKYVLIDSVNKKIYPLASHSLLDKFAGQKVHIQGVYDKDANLLSVVDIKAR